MILSARFAREHNRLAEQLASSNRHWGDEQVYQNARKIVIAQIQHITFSEFLPLVLGRNQVEKYNVQPVDYGFYRGNFFISENANRYVKSRKEKSWFVVVTCFYFDVLKIDGHFTTPIQV